MQPLMAAIIVQRMVLWIVDGGDEQDKIVKRLNCQQQGQHHVCYSTTGCGGPITNAGRFADQNSCNGSDIHDKNRPSHAVVVVHFNDAIFTVRYVMYDVTRAITNGTPCPNMIPIRAVVKDLVFA